MAVKDHSLDQLIVDAARAEFMAHGFQKASLHKIAERAGITTGALYTRYKNKDALFCSLIEDALKEIAAHMEPIGELYMEAHQKKSVEAFRQAIQTEEQIYMDLLFCHYDACVLLFCKSSGSSIDQKMHQMMAQKSAQTVAYFQSIARRDLDFSGIELIMTQQFSYYQQILLQGYSKEKAVSCMKTIDIFLEAGWRAILEQIL